MYAYRRVVLDLELEQRYFYIRPSNIQVHFSAAFRFTIETFRGQLLIQQQQQQQYQLI